MKKDLEEKITVYVQKCHDLEAEFVTESPKHVMKRDGKPWKACQDHGTA